MEGQCYPHEYQSILRGSDSPAIHANIPLEKLYDQLCAGVFLNNRTVKYSVEKESQKNCFMMYARGFSIACSDDPSCWKWVTEKDAPSDGVLVEMAELLKVRWLDVRGKFDLSNLSPATTYEAVFVIKLKSSGYGWEVPVNFGVTLPDGTKKEHKVNLKEKPKDQWIEIKAGEVSTSEYKEGQMEVFMYEHSDHWKSGLVLKGVLIRPKNYINK
ncbi:protein PHLOEM PROTEIN 2-LIKE A1-like isoform X1 [Syzygium oleosum]|uniref:protein PHLOEM PROTEIN 2-LIKE A1-like isoform X1 n=1 Tax=Syzygium oleosum TaxID=219896 RepID=UPI0024B97B0F|nr:protein PHLOEM PROTEIN 2-LIKE A1-like isoform X1 [Syzygium oleosum]